MWKKFFVFMIKNFNFNYIFSLFIIFFCFSKNFKNSRYWSLRNGCEFSLKLNFIKRISGILGFFNFSFIKKKERNFIIIYFYSYLEKPILSFLFKIKQIIFYIWIKQIFFYLVSLFVFLFMLKKTSLNSLKK
jgi:hypothetical protein